MIRLTCRHSDLIQQGAVFCVHLKKLKEAGKAAILRLPRKFIGNRIDCMNTYTEFMIPPDPFGGLCPCLKPQRAGPDYEKQLKRIEMQIMSSTLMTEYAEIEIEVFDALTFTSQYTESSMRISSLQDRLEIVYPKDDPQALDTARRKLQSIAEEIEQFVRSHLETEDLELKAEANRRVNLAIEGLSLSQPYKSLILNQASLQEVMNTCAASNERKAKLMLRQLDHLTEKLRGIKEKESAHLKMLMDPSSQMLDVMNEYQNEAELFVDEVERRLDDAGNQWRQIKAQSACRPVATFEEDLASNSLKQSNNPGEILIDPKKALKKTGKSIEKIGKGIASVPLKGLELVADGVDGFANIATSGATKVAELAGKGVEGVVNVKTKVSSEIVKAVGPEKPKKPQKRDR